MGREGSQCSVAGGEGWSPEKSSRYAVPAQGGDCSRCGHGKRLELRMWEHVEGGRGGCHSSVGLNGPVSTRTVRR